MIVVYILLACLGGFFGTSKGLSYVAPWLSSLSPGHRQRGQTSPVSSAKVSSAKTVKPLDEVLEESTAVAVARPVANSARPQQARTHSALIPNPNVTPTRIIVAMTGATGAILGIRLLEKLRRLNIETHLVISKWADATISYETDFKLSQVKALAYKSYSSNDVAAPISSGSFKVAGMIVVPCSMKTLSAIATGFGDDLIARAADVTFKERRKLVLVARETPLSGIHLQNMMTVTRNGAIIFPPVPAFYTRPKTVDDIVEQSVGRMLDLFDLETGDFARWDGMHFDKHTK